MPLELGAALHVFVAVLLLGTLWRITAYHLMASSNPTWQHVGAGMITQY
jgi:hypothetical protein